ncbi:hypothetical protein WJX72_001733 [[Myrmecia] bisecta]|uniref:U-box domain-containing protein n=1 Tax=[Myrmecia] bisecta TaxID=41462 RepID=A0AAW1QP34_9CHLO
MTYLGRRLETWSKSHFFCDIDLFTLSEDGSKLVVNTRWLYHLQERLVDDHGDPRVVRDGAQGPIPSAQGEAAGPNDKTSDLPDDVILSMLEREMLLTRAKLHALNYEHHVGERNFRRLQTQLRQVEPEFDRLRRELEEIENQPHGMEGTFRTAAETERHRAQLADAALEQQLEVQAAFREHGSRLQGVYDNRQRTELEMARREKEMKRLQGRRVLTAEEEVHCEQLRDVLCCPITQVIFQDPVIAADGQTYERSAIDDWLQRNNTSPMLNTQLPHKKLSANRQIKALQFPASGVVNLNVRDVHYLTTVETLSSRSNYFERLSSGALPTTALLDGRFFVDRNGALFSKILDYPRSGVVPKGIPSAQLRAEAEYFLIQPLLDELDQRLLFPTSGAVELLVGLQHFTVPADLLIERCGYFKGLVDNNTLVVRASNGAIVITRRGEVFAHVLAFLFSQHLPEYRALDSACVQLFDDLRADADVYQIPSLEEALSRAQAGPTFPLLGPVMLDVGGTLFPADADALVSKSNYFEVKGEPQWEDEEVDPEAANVLTAAGHFYIACDPRHFRRILDFVLYAQLPWTDEFELFKYDEPELLKHYRFVNDIMREAEFYRIHRLVSDCRQESGAVMKQLVKLAKA